MSNRSLAKTRIVVCLSSLMLFLLSGCSVKKMAMNKVGDALSGGSGTFASDDDPELIREALPFSLKLMESVLSETPDHDGLLLSLASGFAQYGYGFVQLDADIIEDEDYDKAEALRNRAIKLYLRGKRYGMRGLNARVRDFEQTLLTDQAAALERTKKGDVPLLYWTALSWAGAIALSLDNPDLVGDLAFIGAMMERAMELDESFDFGSIHSFFITYEMSRLDGAGDPIVKATNHYRRANELSGGNLASIYVAYAEAVSVDQQNKEEFISLLNQALSIDIDEYPEWRLANLIYQRRAEWLLTRLDWLFL